MPNRSPKRSSRWTCAPDPTQTRATRLGLTETWSQRTSTCSRIGPLRGRHAVVWQLGSPITSITSNGDPPCMGNPQPGQLLSPVADPGGAECESHRSASHAPLPMIGRAMRPRRIDRLRQLRNEVFVSRPPALRAGDLAARQCVTTSGVDPGGRAGSRGPDLSAGQAWPRKR